ncbi:MAG TPA: glutamyl-tRNA reductase [Solirubrobacterales bacterium]|nr:glutamyl-tRNA reductase [Solirubrobacterales bacterium]
MNGLLVIGVSHKTAPVELRERVALPEGRAVSVLRELVSSEHIHEAVALSTCNRTELYMVVADDVEAETAALGILARQADIRPTELVAHLYSLRNGDATRHLFRVTAGLDAMIVGEAEIQGQVKRAYELALVENTTSAFMNRLFREALAAGKRVRTETTIGGSTVSVSSVAVQLAQETLGDLSGRRVVVIGAGETGELTARALTERGVSSVFVANRHYDRAIGLAHRFGGQAVRFEALPAELELADIVVSSTGSPHHIVERDELEAVMSARHGRPLLLIDIAVPRDIDPVVREIEGVHLRDFDDLQRMVESKLSGREAEARRAESLLEIELERFQRWLGTLDIVPTISAMYERGEEIARQVLAENSGRWESLSEADRERLELVASAIVKRLLHQPTLNLKARGEDQRTYAYVQALRELFGLDVPERSAFDALRPEDAARRPKGAEVTAIRSRRRRQRR